MFSRPLCGSERPTGTPWLTCSQRYGGHGERETPGTIANPEAKPLSADGTAPETGWESRTPPDNHSRTGVRATCSDPRSVVSAHFLQHCACCSQSRGTQTVMSSPRRGAGGTGGQGPRGGRGGSGQGRPQGRGAGQRGGTPGRGGQGAWQGRRPTGGR